MTEESSNEDIIPINTESGAGFDYDAHKRRMEEYEEERRRHLWPFQDYIYDPEAKRGRPISISWLKIIETVEMGVSDLCHSTDLRWNTLQTYASRDAARQIKSRIQRKYLPNLPPGDWQFQVVEDPFQDKTFYFQARYLPRKFSQIERIVKIPEEKRSKLLQMLQEYAQNKRNSIQDG